MHSEAAITGKEFAAMPLSEEDLNYTQRLSREIDAAYEARKAGDQNGDERLYKALQAQAHNIAIHHLDWSQVVTVERDIVHRAMMALKGFREDSKVSTWFYRLAVNEANRALRDRKIDRDRFVPLIVTDQSGEEREREIEAKPASDDARIQFEKLRSQLPPKQADLMSLLQEGYTLEESAKKMKVPLGTVRSRYRLAKARLGKLRRKPKTRKRK
jgi:RNA polymerase sigma factor (sigma-70 family)